MQTLGKVLLALLAFALTGFCLFSIYFGVSQIYLANQSKSWSATNGRIIDAKVVCSSSKNGRSYRPKVTYAYEVNGIEYRNERFSFGAGNEDKYGFGGGTEEFAKETLKQYQLGSEIIVFYDKENPVESCLKTGGINWKNGLPVVLGVFMLFGILLIWRIRRSSNPTLRRRYYRRRFWS
jgi:hypothetical protein